MMKKLLILNKPYDVLCKFTDAEGRPTLADYVDVKDVYPAGRLDKTSEGLVVLTNDGGLQHRLSDPRHKLPKTYWVQVEGVPTDAALSQLRDGVDLNDGRTLPAQVQRMESSEVWARIPPIRERQQIPTAWIALTIIEGRNRQVRRMTAHVGYPTLRLIRYSVGPWTLGDLQPGEWRVVPFPRDWRDLQMV